MRIAATLLTLMLLIMLIAFPIQGVGNWKTYGILAFGVVLGALYSIFGRIPDWLLNLLGDSVTTDDDPRNISPRTYLPILLVAIVIAGCLIYFAFR